MAELFQTLPPRMDAGFEPFVHLLYPIDKYPLLINIFIPINSTLHPRWSRAAPRYWWNRVSPCPASRKVWALRTYGRWCKLFQGEKTLINKPENCDLTVSKLEKMWFHWFVSGWIGEPWDFHGITHHKLDLLTMVTYSKSMAISRTDLVGYLPYKRPISYSAKFWGIEMAIELRRPQRAAGGAR